MANRLGSIPWVIDTAGLVVSGHVKLSTIRWSGYAADTDTFVLNDVNGRVVCQGNGASDLSPVEFNIYAWVQGLNLASIVAGQLQVFTD